MGKCAEVSAVTDKRIDGFQGRRGLVILLIMISHGSWPADKNGNSIVIWSGGLGVQFLIMLSGFLAVSHYLNRETTGERVGASYKHKLHKYYRLHMITLVAAMPVSLDSSAAIQIYVGSDTNAWGNVNIFWNFVMILAALTTATGVHHLKKFKRERTE